LPASFKSKFFSYMILTGVAQQDHVSFLAFSPTHPALLASVGSRDRRAFLSHFVTGICPGVKLRANI
jgi:hypothetical protein